MKLVFLEGFLVSIVGIPIGLLSGTVAIDIVFKVIKTFFKTSMFGELDLRVEIGRASCRERVCQYV